MIIDWNRAGGTAFAAVCEAWLIWKIWRSFSTGVMNLQEGIRGEGDSTYINADREKWPMLFWAGMIPLIGGAVILVPILILIASGIIK
ncbi:MAG TPA: hypothetical protein VNV38_22085 [Stellaceae bacterium]|jgi:hypothetical protein|nr:hypothetical protein [Stellaceae bacterium]